MSYNMDPFSIKYNNQYISSNLGLVDISLVGVKPELSIHSPRVVDYIYRVRNFISHVMHGDDDLIEFGLEMLNIHNRDYDAGYICGYNSFKSHGDQLRFKSSMRYSDVYIDGYKAGYNLAKYGTKKV